MKKIYSLSFAVLLSLSLVSCKDDDKNNNPTPSTVVDPRAKFIGTFTGTLTCTPQGGSAAGNVTIVAGPTESQLDVVGAGIATINGNSFTIPAKTTTSSGMSTTTSYSGTLNGTTLAFSTTSTVSYMGTSSTAVCSGNMVKQ